MSLKNTVLFFSLIVCFRQALASQQSFDTSINEDTRITYVLHKYFPDTPKCVFKVTIDTTILSFVMHGDSLTITPDPNANGYVSFMVKQYVDTAVKATRGFNITILPVNDPPKFTGKLRDTAIQNDAGLNLNLRSIASDVDNSIGELHYKMVPVPGVRWVETDSGITIILFQKIDTFTVRCIVYDPSDSSDTTSFKLNPNAPLKVGERVVLIRSNDVNVAADNSTSIPAVHKGAVDIVRYVNDTMTVSRYNSNWQKLFPTKVLLTYSIFGDHSNPSNPPEFKCIKLDTSYLIIFIASFDTDAPCHLALFNSSFEEIGEYPVPGPNRVDLSIAAAQQIGDRIYFYGNSGYYGIRLDEFDLYLNHIGSVAIDTTKNEKRCKYFGKKSNSYTMLWQESDTLFKRDFSNTNVPAGSKSRVDLPTPAGLNTLWDVTVVGQKNGYFLCYSKGAVWNKTNFYIQKTDSNFVPVQASVLIDGNNDVMNTFECVVESNNKYLVSWKTWYYGPGDPIYKKGRIFRNTLSAISDIFALDDGTPNHSGWFPMLQKVSDTFLFKLSYDTVGNSYGSFCYASSLFGIASVNEKMAIKPLTESVRSNGRKLCFEDFTEDHIDVAIVNAAGKRILCKNFNSPGQKIVDIAHMSKGVYFCTIKSETGSRTEKFLIMGNR
jgi:hypothetical protein